MPSEAKEEGLCWQVKCFYLSTVQCRLQPLSTVQCWLQAILAALEGISAALESTPKSSPVFVPEDKEGTSESSPVSVPETLEGVSAVLKDTPEPVSVSVPGSPEPISQPVTLLASAVMALEFIPRSFPNQEFVPKTVSNDNTIFKSPPLE